VEFGKTVDYTAKSRDTTIAIIQILNLGLNWNISWAGFPINTYNASPSYKNFTRLGFVFCYKDALESFAS
jgi:hypothetical protein